MMVKRPMLLLVLLSQVVCILQSHEVQLAVLIFIWIFLFDSKKIALTITELFATVHKIEQRILFRTYYLLPLTKLSPKSFLLGTYFGLYLEVGPVNHEYVNRMLLCTHI